ncbi:MAG: multicopper oxidase family protein [bacterium]|nr:multicopper oxidase family protein [bacterium]
MKTILYAVVVIVVLGAIYLLAGTTSPTVQNTQLVELKDGDTYALTASYVTKVVAGKAQKMLAYNGSIPGPTIKVSQGAEVTINLKNETDLSAALHSHGVRMDNPFDGAPPVTQKEIAPGESFSYKLKFPDAGIYWYHPHVHEAYEQPLGLYGAFVVTPNDANYFPPVNREMPLFLSDIPVENGKITLRKNDMSHALMGRYGNVFLTNGEEHFSLEASAGEVVRFYVVNAATTRPFNVAIPGATIKVVGGDNGAYEKAFFTESVLLGPSERAIIDVLFEKAGSYELQNKTPNAVYVLGTIVVRTDAVATPYTAQFAALQENKAVQQSVAAFLTYFGKAPDKKLVLALGSGMMPANIGHGSHMMPDGSAMGGPLMSQNPGGIEWEDTVMMDQMSAGGVAWKIVDQDTGKVNMDIDWTLKRDVPIKIRIENPAASMHPMQHPIHFHGQRFLVAYRDGVRQTNLVWKDTVLVKAGEIVDIILEPSNPGVWMAHCHIAEHLEAGMMFMFRVE